MRHAADDRLGISLFASSCRTEGQARGVQIDIAPACCSLRYPMEVNLVGDSAETLRALLPLLQAEDGDGAGARDRKTVSKSGGRRSKSARCVRPIRSIRSA